MHEPLVNITMPSYNHAGFIGLAIESVLAQTHANFELIICDDCSQDDSYAVALEYTRRDARVVVMRNAENLGIVKTRQRLLENCRGVFVGHLDSDDVLERWAIEEAVRVMNDDPDIALVYSDSATIDVAGNVTGYRKDPDFSYSNLMYLGWRHFGLYRRELAVRYGGYNTRIASGCEDGDLFMKLASRHPCKHLQKVLYFHRYHGNNSSAKSNKCPTCELRRDCNYFDVWSKVTLEFFPDHEVARLRLTDGLALPDAAEKPA